MTFPTIFFFYLIGKSIRPFRRKFVQVVSILILLQFIVFPIDVLGFETLLRVDPESPAVWGVEESFYVNLTGVGCVNLYGWEIKLYYDRNVLNGTAVSEGPFLKARGGTFFNASINNNYNATHGRVMAFCSLLGNVSGAAGTGVLATVNFRTTAAGSSLLELRDTMLGDINGAHMSHFVSDAAVSVFNTYRDVAVKSVLASPMEAAAGQPVNITVVVRNQGNKSESFDVRVRANSTLVGAASVSGLLPATEQTLLFKWDTSGGVTGTVYIMRAEATAVPDEADLDNNVLEDGVVRIIEGKHDVGIRSVRLSKTRLYEGQTVEVFVTVLNKGHYNESFNVAAYYDNVIFATKTVSDLAFSSERLLTFAWNTAGVSNRSYVIKAVADPVPGETSMADNTFVDGNVTILSRSLLSIRIISVTPCSQIGDPRSDFSRGTLANFKISINSNSMGAEDVLLTVNVYDEAQTTIGIVSFKGLIAPGTTTFILSFPIPATARLGNAAAYANALTNWPHLGGVPYCPESRADFRIVGA